MLVKHVVSTLLYKIVVVINKDFFIEYNCHYLQSNRTCFVILTRLCASIINKDISASTPSHSTPPTCTKVFSQCIHQVAPSTSLSRSCCPLARRRRISWKGALRSLSSMRENDWRLCARQSFTNTERRRGVAVSLARATRDTRT